MAKITVAGQAVVITSTMKLEDIETIQKYRPEALVITGGEDGKDELFRVGVGSSSINKFGASFKEATRDENKFAVITMTTNYDGDDIKEFIADELGTALTNLALIEKRIPEVLEVVEMEREEIMESIVIA